MVNPKVYADFQNADASGRVRLNCVGTSEDLAQQRISLLEGMVLTLYSDDLDANGQLADISHRYISGQRMSRGRGFALTYLFRGSRRVSGRAGHAGPVRPSGAFEGLSEGFSDATGAHRDRRVMLGMASSVV